LEEKRKAKEEAEAMEKGELKRIEDEDEQEHEHEHEKARDARETKERAWMFWRKWAARKKTKLIPLQAELGLDMVRVMRNDLSDADLEVVKKPVKAKKAAEVVREERLAETLAPPAVEGRLGGDTEPYQAEPGKKEDLRFGI